MRNFTPLQFILFTGTAVVGLAALSAAGVAAGLALGGAAILAVLALAGWMMVANLISAERPVRRRKPHPAHPAR
ncbi:hypothetical protein [Caulobacter sp. S45]|jgi:hypothetical protein|uniref:hypothetical protein n=1 Tax=Caulobacter sp. S45 TaxID=1641861 RepID=UPI00131E9C60|nr:hypothetical protein [Caulobacter sp. S45]